MSEYFYKEFLNVILISTAILKYPIIMGFPFTINLTSVQFSYLQHNNIIYKIVSIKYKFQYFFYGNILFQDGWKRIILSENNFVGYGLIEGRNWIRKLATTTLYQTKVIINCDFVNFSTNRIYYYFLLNKYKILCFNNSSIFYTCFISEWGFFFFLFFSQLSKRIKWNLYIKTLSLTNAE